MHQWVNVSHVTVIITNVKGSYATPKHCRHHVNNAKTDSHINSLLDESTTRNPCRNPTAPIPIIECIIRGAGKAPLGLRIIDNFIHSADHASSKNTKHNLLTIS